MGCEHADKPALVVLGASTRAAAFSAVRAGFAPVCADAFGDRDLAASCPTYRLSSGTYPSGLEHAARQAADCPWAYTGSMENYPDLVAQIAAARELWGNGPDVLRRVRDPFRVASCLARAGLHHPAVCNSHVDLPCDGSWLVKPIHGTGGRGIRPLDQPLGLTGPAHCYFQQRIDGPSYAALFVSDGRNAKLVGLTRQLIGDPAFNAKPFHYCGSVGPVPVDSALRAQLILLAQSLTEAFQLRGLFGVDGIMAARGFWPVEVNPRYTASVEILEFALGVPLMALHRDGCTGHFSSASVAFFQSAELLNRRYVGKGILFAPQTITVPDLSQWLVAPLEASPFWPIPRLADVPWPGEIIEAGRPICTVFAVDSSMDACRDSLNEAARRVYRILLSAD